MAGMSLAFWRRSLATHKRQLPYYRARAEEAAILRAIARAEAEIAALEARAAAKAACPGCACGRCPGNG